MKADKERSSTSVRHLLSFNRTQCAVVTTILYYEGHMTSAVICKELGLSKTAVARALQTLISAEIIFTTKDVPVKSGIKGEMSLSQALKVLDSLSGGGSSNETKQKLTLTISKDVIERVRDTGINISAITEEFLKAVTYEYFSLASHDMHLAYLDLFKAIKPVVDLYNLEVEVGRTASTDDSRHKTFVPLFLSYRVEPPALWTTMWRNNQTMWTISSVGQELDNLYSPRVILENLIEAVIKLSQNDEVKVQQLKIGLRLTNAVFATEE